MNDNTDQTAWNSLIQPLSNCLPPNAGPVRLIHDATLARPLRLRDHTGVKLPKDVHETASALLTRLENQLGPLQIHYVLADVPESAGNSAVLDAGRLGTLPRLFFARAATNNALQGLELDIRPRLRVVLGRCGDRHAIDTTLDVRTADPSDEDEEIHEALKAFGRWAAPAWANAVASTVAPWLL